MLLFQPRIPSPLLLWKVLEDFIPQVVTRLGTQGRDIFLLFCLPGSSFYRAGLLAVTLRLNCPVASSLTRDQTCNPFTGQWILNHWTTREVLFLSFLFFFYWKLQVFKNSVSWPGIEPGPHNEGAKSPTLSHQGILSYLFKRTALFPSDKHPGEECLGHTLVLYIYWNRVDL